MQKSFTAFCNLTKSLDDVRTHTQLFYKYRNGYQLFLIDLRLHICEYLTNKTSSRLLDVVMPTISQYLVIDQNFTCPFIGRFDVVNMPILGSFFNNMFVPVGDYMANVTFNTNKTELIWNGQFYFTIPAGKTIEDDRMGR